MAYDDNELFASRDFTGSIRQVVEHNKVATFSTGTAELLIGLPVARAKSTGYYAVWQPPVSAITTITSDRTGGTFTMTVDGKTTAAIDATAGNCTAAVLTAALALLLPTESFTVSGTDLSGDGLVVTFHDDELYGRMDIDPSVADSGSGGTGLSLAETAVGVDDDGLADIDAFVAHDKVQLVSGYQVLGKVQTVGEIHRDDVNTATMRALLGGTPTENNLDAALKRMSLRQAGIRIKGLAGVA